MIKGDAAGASPDSNIGVDFSVLWEKKVQVSCAFGLGWRLAELYHLSGLSEQVRETDPMQDALPARLPSHSRLRKWEAAEVLCGQIKTLARDLQLAPDLTKELDHKAVATGADPPTTLKRHAWRVHIASSCQ